MKATRQLKEIIEQLAKAKKARESGRSDRDLKALELKLAECQSVVDKVGDPPLKFLKAAERVKLVPSTTHRLGQGGIPDLKATFVNTLPLLHFFFCKDSNKVEFLSNHIELFGIPLRCEWRLFRKGTMLFVSQTTSQVTECKGLRFAKEVVDLNKSQIASQVTICEGLRFTNMRFY